MKVLHLNQPAQFSTDLEAEPIVAAGKVTRMADYRYPVEPPRDWFARRKFDQARPVEVSKDGHVYGHVAEWGVPHIGYGTGRRVLPPKSRSKYAHFLTSHVLCDDGAQVKTGPLYIDCDHADLDLNIHQAKEHMAHTGSAVADVAVFEDEFGIQVAGALRPTASPAQVRVVRGSDVSPDWRPVPGGHEMVGLVSVNTSGFITKGLVASAQKGVAAGEARVRWDEKEDRPLAMVAVGMVRHKKPDPFAELKEEFAEQLRPIREFMADHEADQIMERFAASPVFKERLEKADEYVRRAEEIVSED
jgi:hypothetical protein